VFPFAARVPQGIADSRHRGRAGASRPTWGFGAFHKIGNQVNTIGWGGGICRGSYLPGVPGVKVAAGLPAYAGIAGQPCRPVAAS
jgi:hypothetical protein